ncbi:class I SAM-dependent methyltransferase [Halomonas heilongjiangensis]|uniref:class I SAM-dependent methyltransferase n=1 Tax=Halomonas heilongjiangensis TaxID=1387883 RepID=UPI000D769D42|nr:class I SAM-dependent methyltransferase [Halomonas heilongjiangensis]PXX88108.1 methyltransferase type 12 [Halomonas heilongjiangensis]
MNTVVPDARFTADWLGLREEQDRRSRSHRLTGLVADWLAARPGVHGVVDLGSGSGSNLHFLAPRLPGPQRWRLVDHDPELLVLARRRGARLCDGAGARVTLATRCRDLAPVDDDLLAGVDLVAASALFDLVSRDWAEALVAACAARHQALLVTLSVDGDWAFRDAAGERLDTAEDAAVRVLFRAHQRRDKGLGTALGAEAPAVLARAMRAAGYRVESAATPWHLAAGVPAGRALATALVDGWYAAAREQAPAEGGRLAHWRERRLAGLAAGELGVTVGHRDLLALPEPPAGGR